MMVMFATTCDKCKARSEEYTMHPECRSCGEDVCRACLIPELIEDKEDGSRVTGVCKECGMLCPQCHGAKIITVAWGGSPDKVEDIYCEMCEGDGWLMNRGNE